MILAAGLTPAWQHILVFEEFVSGEVNRAQQAAWCASGKVLNVGLALHALRADSRTLSVIGGDAGTAIEREFQRSNIPARWIHSTVPTRVCTTILNRGSGTTTELVENSGSLEADLREQFANSFREEGARAEFIVLTGSLPAGTPSGYYRDLLQSLPRGTSSWSDVPVILDVRGPELLNALECRPLVVKPNRRELEATFGRDLSDDRRLITAMRELNNRGAEWVLITEGKEPAWVSSAQGIYRLYPPQSEAVNPIGCGDCMAAGIAWALASEQPALDAFKFGVAAAVDNLSQLLPARLDPERVRRLAGVVDVTAIV